MSATAADTDLVPYPWVVPFLAAVAMHGMVNKAAKSVGVSLKKIESLELESIEFEEALREAKETAADRIEAEVQRRAIDGIPKGVYYQGQLVDTEIQYSDSLLAMLVKAKRRDIFGDKQEITGAGGGPLQILVRAFPSHPDATLPDPTSTPNRVANATVSERPVIEHEPRDPDSLA